MLHMSGAAHVAGLSHCAICATLNKTCAQRVNCIGAVRGPRSLSEGTHALSRHGLLSMSFRESMRLYPILFEGVSQSELMTHIRKSHADTYLLFLNVSRNVGFNAADGSHQSYTLCVGRVGWVGVCHVLLQSMRSRPRWAANKNSVLKGSYRATIGVGLFCRSLLWGRSILKR